MSVGTPTLANPFALPPYPVRRFTVEEYHRLIEAGFFVEDERFELLEGWIVPKMSRNPSHDVTVDKVQELIRDHVPRGWRVRVQCAITTADSEPEPDIAVAPGPAELYAQRHPGPQDISLLVEVADSSLARDHGEKLRLYARAGIVCYWVVNLVNRQVEVYTDPTGPDATPTYRQRQDYLSGDAVPLVVGGQEVARVAVAVLLA